MVRAIALLIITAQSALAGPHCHPPLLPTEAVMREHRDLAQRKLFMTITGYAHGRPGYIVDHIVPLKRGGADAWWNMQWQTIEQARAKDRTE